MGMPSGTAARANRKPGRRADDRPADGAGLRHTQQRAGQCERRPDARGVADGERARRLRPRAGAAPRLEDGAASGHRGQRHALADDDNEGDRRFLANNGYGGGAAIPEPVVPAGVDVFNLSLEQTRGSGWTAALHPEDVEMVSQVWTRALQTGELLDVEYRLRAGDGAYHWFLARGNAVRDRDGRVVKWFGLLTEVNRPAHPGADENARRGPDVKGRQATAPPSPGKGS